MHKNVHAKGASNSSIENKEITSKRKLFSMRSIYNLTIASLLSLNPTAFADNWQRIEGSENDSTSYSLEVNLDSVTEEGRYKLAVYRILPLLKDERKYDMDSKRKSTPNYLSRGNRFITLDCSKKLIYPDYISTTKSQIKSRPLWLKRNKNAWLSNSKANQEGYLVEFEHRSENAPDLTKTKRADWIYSIICK